MGELFSTVVAFLVTVGVLVVVHEFGHYLAARAMDVKILRFNIGFGKPLFLRRRGRDHTEWVVAAVPLGGYVKMLDEREGPVPPGEEPRAFNNKSVWARSFIVLAGPIANFLLAIALYWVLFVAGMPGDVPVLADPPRGTPAAVAGLASGDTITHVGDEAVQTWSDVRWAMLKHAVARDETVVEVRSRDGRREVNRLDMSSLTREDLDQDLLVKLGIRAYRPAFAPRLGPPAPASPAERAGFREGDLVTAVDGVTIATWDEFVGRVRPAAGRRLAVEVEREGAKLVIDAVPEARKDGAGQLGLQPALAVLKKAYEPFTTTVRYGPAEAAARAVEKVWDLSVFSVKMLARMVMGQLSWKNLSGPITIADYAGQSARLGWVTSLGFLALVSVSLGVLNLLPIPLLDGGHLVYYFAEIVKGTPVSEKTMEIGQRLGLALLLGLTFFAFYNDLNRLFTG
ncbi:MAG TPA: RIP metalloprotease RseP [Usitatibacter sp.]|nr:RIP metalloprotease RseP [Usitatibacter sp.]